MKILQEITPKKVKNIVIVEDDDKDTLRRIEYEDGTYDWEADNFDGEFEEEDIEEVYQETLRLSKIKQFKSGKSLQKECIHPLAEPGDKCDNTTCPEDCPGKKLKL